MSSFETIEAWACASHRYTLDEHVNYGERLAWLRQLVPVYGPSPYGPNGYIVCSLLPSTYYIGTLPDVGIGQLSRVTTAPLTVEADGDPSITCDLPHYQWPRYGGHGRWDNTFIDHISAARWYRVEHGQLSHVSHCEVTL